MTDQKVEVKKEPKEDDDKASEPYLQLGLRVVKFHFTLDREYIFTECNVVD